MSTTTTYRVRYNVTNEIGEVVRCSITHVMILEGYSTKDDIPRILSIPNQVSVEDIVILSITPT